MNLEDIVKIQEERRDREKRLFEDLYMRASTKIKQYVTGGSQACIYTVPNFIFGYPLIDVPKATEFLLARLNHEGFIAFQVEKTADKIYISWELSELERRKMIKRKKEQQSKVSIEAEKEKRDDDLMQALVSAKVKHRRR